MVIHRSKLHIWIHHLVHHFLVALLIASIITILEYRGYLNWLDSGMLRLVSSLQKSQTSNNNFGVHSLLISDTYFENEFKQSSPLNRQEIAAIINKVLSKNPSVVAIDLDLSPIFADVYSNEQKYLDDILFFNGRNGNSKIVLITPFPVITDESLKTKYDWMVKMCNSGIYFAYPNLVSSMGYILRYSSSIPTLGVVANKVNDSKLDPKYNLCNIVNSGDQNTFFLSKLFPLGDIFDTNNLPTQKPINNYFLKSSYSQGTFINHLKQIDDFSNFNNIAVFLGASFNQNDFFYTTYGVRNGSNIHAAIYASEKIPVSPLQHSVVLIIDIILGVAAGFVFSNLWDRVNLASHRNFVNPGIFSLWVSARFWFVCAFAVLFLWLLMLLWLSSWLLNHNFWGNPGPLIIGVFLKTLIASRHSFFNNHNISNKNYSLPSKIIINLDLIILSPLVIYALILIFHH